MDQITLTRQLMAQGYSPNAVARMVRAGHLVPLRRGAYLESDPPTENDDRQVHRALIRANLAYCSSEAVVSRMSAAVLHDLPIWPDGLGRVQLTRDRAGGGRTSRNVEVRGTPLGPDDVTLIDGIPTTTLARTVLDLACQLPMDRAVAVGDAALRQGLSRGELDQALTRARNRRGAGRARETIAFLDPRSESVGESRSRVVFHLHGLPAPELQWIITAPDGTFIARTDFCWPAYGVVGEFDGRVKYERSLRPGHYPAAELFREKRREDAIRQLDWLMVRWISRDIDRSDDLIGRLSLALARGRRLR